MHNRVRMVVASFLIKDLHIGWWHGAGWFMEHLRDGDIAQNQLNWQWVAGCGTDAAPYFRIFNPTAQAEKFDPDGSYIRRYVPRARRRADRTPAPAVDRAARRAERLPEPIVDHAVERKEALGPLRRCQRSLNMRSNRAASAATASRAGRSGTSEEPCKTRAPGPQPEAR